MKTFITLGLIADKHVVLKDPSTNYKDHSDYVRSLIADGGKIKSGKTEKQASEAVVALINYKAIAKKVKFK